MDDELDNLFGLAIHEAIDLFPTEGMDGVAASRIDRIDGLPQPGWIDGSMDGLAVALRLAGWTPPEGVIDRWRAEVAKYPERINPDVLQSR